MSSKKILFIKLSALGDVVMALPACRFLVSQGHQVTWVVGQAAKSLVETYSKAQTVLVIDEQKLLAGSTFQKGIQVLKTNWLLKDHQSDQIILGHADPRYRYMVGLVKWVKTNYVPIHDFKFPKDLHHSKAYMQLAHQCLGASATDGELERQIKENWPKPLVPWVGQNSKMIALAPGGAKNILADDDLRRWPIEHYRSLAEALIRKGYEVHIFGALSDQWVRPGFHGLAVKDRIGEFGLLEMINQLSRYKALITHDSGPLHLGGLSGVPVYGLFGPTLPEWRFPLVNPGRGLVLDQKLTCQPCYDGKNYPACEHKNCLRTLSPQQVLSNF